MNIFKIFFNKFFNINSKEIRQNKKAPILIGAFTVLVCLFFLSLSVGAVKIPLPTLLGYFTGLEFFTKSATGVATSLPESGIATGKNADSLWRIFYYVRLPRSLAALLSGVALSLSGTILQTVLNNPMCSPSIIGVNAGAGLFMILVTAFFPSQLFLAPLAAFVGALVAVMAVFIIAKKTGASKLAIVLSGIAVSSLLSAFTDAVVTLVPEAKVSRVDFLIGSFSGVTMGSVSFAALFIGIGLLASLLLSFDLNILALGDATALSLGQRVGLIRAVFLVLAALLAGSAISLAGLIGFVGLLIPHASKILIGHDKRLLLPLSALLGGAFCLGCDLLARILFIPFELPVGIIMSFLGSPFFIYLILSRKRRASLE